MTITPTSFLKQSPTRPSPLCSTCLYSLHPFLCYYYWYLCFYLKAKCNSRLQQTQWPCSIAPVEERQKGRNMKDIKDHHGLRSGTTRSLACLFKIGSVDMFPAVSLHWLGEQEVLFHKHHCVWVSRGYPGQEDIPKKEKDTHKLRITA